MVPWPIQQFRWVDQQYLGQEFRYLKEELMKSPLVLLRSLLIDFSRLEPSVKGLDRDFLTIKRRFKHEGYGFLTKTLPSFGDAFDRGLSEGRFCSPSSFKKAKGSALPRFLSGLLSEVFDPISGLVKDDASHGCILCIRELTRILKKVRLDEEDSDKLHSEALDGFFRNDKLIGTDILQSRDAHLFRIVCSYTLPNLKEEARALHSALDPLGFKHGPGAVAEGFRPNQKWNGVYEGILTDAFDTGKYRYDLFALMSRMDLSSVSDLLKDHIQLTPDILTSASVASSSSARLVSVAKNSSSRRVITVEPMLNQFIQQGLNLELRDSIKQCEILSCCLSLTSQEENQKLALEGSKYQNWSTIDLKSASDLLSKQLVEHSFQHVPQFLSDMLECRSRYVKDGTTAIEIAKYAGMGNATTFPVQSVVFALLAITAIVDDGISRPSYWKVKRAARCVRVFGDDIIVKTKHIHSVVDWLQKAGLIVNQSKSFFDGKFKESCGCDAYNGVNVTPLYLRFRPDDSSTDPNAIAGLVAFSNNAWSRGLYETATCIANEVEERLGYSLPLVSRSSSALGWHSRLDAMTPHFWDRKLQRPVTRAPVLVSLKRKDKLDGWPALLKFFHVPLLGRPLKHLLESSVRFKLKIARKRVPTEVG